MSEILLPPVGGFSLSRRRFVQGLAAEYELKLTQQWVLSPEAEVNFYTNDVQLVEAIRAWF